jgi:hypothetical protein
MRFSYDDSLMSTPIYLQFAELIMQIVWSHKNDSQKEIDWDHSLEQSLEDHTIELRVPTNYSFNLIGLAISKLGWNVRINGIDFPAQKGGRPKGAKDKKPRKKRTTSRQMPKRRGVRGRPKGSKNKPKK